MPKITNFKQQPDIPKLEEEVLKFWNDSDAFKQSVENRPEDKNYVFYDGPPFATGMPHYGHLLASTVKDVIPRYWTMKGYRVNRVWGWDCHGLPIENMIEKKLDIKGGKKGIEDLGIDKFNAACRAEVLRLDEEWEKIISRLGRWVDFENNYKTMDTTFMESVWWGFKQLYEKDLIYQGKKVILYCPRCATPLSNFEIAMDNSYEQVTESSNIYKYKVNKLDNTYLLAWSTTPWNKLATPALAVNPNMEYSIVEQNGENYILATDLLKMLKDEPYKVIKTQTGSDLTNLTFEPHYDFFPDRVPGEKIGVIIADDFVTDEEGTGIVTLAVYGEDDYRVMKDHDIQLVEHVDDNGKLRPEVEPWAGMDILEANPLVNEDLEKRGLMYSQTNHTHNVATCYRCGTRLYYAPLPAWFVDVQKLKKNLLKNNEQVNWYPEHLKHGRFGKGLETAPDWNISRSRYWGTPMPIWLAETGEMRIIGSLDELKKWAVDEDKANKVTDIHRQYIDDIDVWVDDNKKIKGKRIPEVFDCWVESGSMPFASVHYPFENKNFFEENYPAQFVSEYIAQTRAWFYTMHVISTGIFNQPPFENVLTTGTLMAEDGSKMSKSKKNYPDPMIVVDKYGVDSLRLYLMSSPVMKSENANFSEKEVADIRRKVYVIWWNVLSFYKTFADTTQSVSAPTKEPQHVMDQWLLSKTQNLIKNTTEYMDNYDVVRASRLVMDFVNELSTWYLRLSRNRLRAENNQEASHIFGYALYALAQVSAPFNPFFSELIHHNMVDDKTSIHLTDWPSINEKLINGQLEAEMEMVRDVITQAHAIRKDLGLKLRQPLASLRVSAPGEKPKDNLLEVIAQETNVKNVDWKLAEETIVEFDTQLTPQLKAEGEARELVRSIQKLRKQAKLATNELVTVEAPSWPEDWQTQIEEQTNSQLTKGDTLQLTS